MEYKISLNPSDQQVRCRSEETILDSLLAAGIAVKYNCSNGSCGTCRARLVEGEIGQQHHHDFHFKEQDKDQGYFLMCRCHPGSDMTIEADIFKGVQDVPEQEIKTKVYRIDDPADDFRVVELKTPRSQTLQFFPGQHVELEIEGIPLRRKSIASCPCDGHHLQFHFHRQVDDTFTDYIFDELASRSKVTIRGPYGNFTFDEHSVRPIILIATEIGFASIKSIAEHIFSLEVAQPIHLFWCVEKEGDDYLSNYCRSWLASEDNFLYSWVSMESLGISGGLDSEDAQQAIGKLILDIYHDLSAHDIYLSGPEHKYKPLITQLMNSGADNVRLHVDKIKRL